MTMVRFLYIGGILGIAIVLSAASPIEIKKPKRGIISTGEFHRIERAGRDAGFAEACKVEWETFHTAFMIKERRKRWTRRQLNHIDKVFTYGQVKAAGGIDSCDTSQRFKIVLKLRRRMLNLKE
jgi:hypothetical protein